MQTHKFGLLQNDVAIIGQGTWNIESADRQDAVKSLVDGLDLGMTHIDTAEMYGSGRAEEIVAEAIKGRRDEVFLVSKVLPSNASREGVIVACEKSLKRLKTDRLDCYLLHWRGEHNLVDTIAAFEELVSEGKILSWGVSNFDETDLEEALEIAGPEKIACNQVLYHLEERAIEHSVLPWCQKHGVALVGYSPFGSTGGFSKENTPAGKVLKEVADAHNATTRQIALAFLTRANSTFAIPKAANPSHAKDNANSSKILLSDAEIARIDAAFPLGRKPSSLPVI